MKKLFFISALLTVSLFASGQKKPSGTGMIMGNVSDSLTRQPLEYVNVGVYVTGKDSLVAGIVTDSTGKFLLQKIPNGKFVLKFSFIGFNAFTSKEITIDAKQQFVMLEPVFLSPAANAIGGVNVEGQRKSFEQTFSKKVFLMDDKRSAGAQTVLDLLRMLPSVTVDDEGNVKFRGQSPTILVDNQPASLMYPRLEMIPAPNVDKIEFIEPSARFAASVGTINIKLKKPKEKGLSGGVFANAGSQDFKSISNEWGGFNINYKYKKLIVFGNVYYGGSQNKSISNYYGYYTFNDSTFNQNGGSEGKNAWQWGSASTGLIWSFTDWKKLTFTYSPWKNNSTSEDNSYSSSFYGSLNRIKSKDYSKNTENRMSNGFSLSYRDNPEDDHKEFSIEANYSRQDFNTANLNRSAYSYYNFHALDSLTLWNSPTEGNTDEFSLEMYYRKNIDTTGRWEAGIRGSGNRENTVYDEYFNNEYKPQFSHHDQSLGVESAIYANFGKKIKKFKLDGGLRLSMGILDFDVNAFVNNADTVLKVNRFVPTLLPSFSLGYEIKPMHELKVSYSYDIQMPQVYQLTPYRTIKYPQSISTGNPDLDPYKFHRFTFGYMFSPGIFSMSLDAFTNYSKNYVSNVNEYLGSNFVFSKPYNVGTLMQNGVTFSLSGMPRQWLDAYITVEVYRNTLDATGLTSELIGTPANTSGLESNNWTVTESIYMNARIKKKFNLTLYLNNNGKNPTLGGYSKYSGWNQITVSRRFMKNMLYVGIGLQNPVDAWSRGKTVTDYMGHHSVSEYEGGWSKRTMRLTVRYYFNKGDRGTNQGAKGGQGMN